MQEYCSVLSSVAEPKLLAPRVGSGADKSYKKNRDLPFFY
jgi:hypothetical protein